MAARGELARYLPMPISWVFADDVASIALLAAERGDRGTATSPWDVLKTPARSPRSASNSWN
jgi:hypothetical protein